MPAVGKDQAGIAGNRYHCRRFYMRRKVIAVLMDSIDREYQQNFADDLVAAGLQYGIDICIFNSRGHMNIEFSE